MPVRSRSVIGATGITGPVTTTNSLYGPAAYNLVGFAGVTALANGNYTVASPLWDNGATANVGAVTFGGGTAGIACDVVSVYGVTAHGVVVELHAGGEHRERDDGGVELGG